jgi:NTE family protein
MSDDERDLGITTLEPVEQRSSPSRGQHPSIALALGGGGARGLAHIHVLEVLDEMGLTPKVIAGTSIGALFGAAFASGMPAAQIRAYALEALSRRFDLVRQLFAARSMPVQKLLRVFPVRSALLDPATVLDVLMPGRFARDFDDLKIPLKVVTTDLGGRTAHVIESGDLRTAIAASIAIPVLFSPVRIGNRTLVDGGLVNPLPFELVIGSADVTVAIDVSGAAGVAELGPRPTALEVAVQSLQILEKSITREKLRALQPDVYIDVDVDRFGALEFWKPAEILAASAPIKNELRRKLERELSTERFAELGE